MRPPIYLPVIRVDPGSCQNGPQWPLSVVLAFPELSPDPFLNCLWLFFLSLPTSPLFFATSRGSSFIHQCE